MAARHAIIFAAPWQLPNKSSNVDLNRMAITRESHWFCSCRFFVLGIAFFYSSLSFGFQVTQRDEQQPEFNVKPKTNVFFAYGDSRFTDPAACELSNQAYRTALVERMTHSAERPDFLVVTGDVVLSGDNYHDW